LTYVRALPELAQLTCACTIIEESFWKWEGAWSEVTS